MLCGRAKMNFAIAGARRGDGKRFIVRIDERPTSFVELESRFEPSLHDIKTKHRARPAASCCG
jgi:hypothetical protein